jgi:hypothetical protein
MTRFRRTSLAALLLAAVGVSGCEFLDNDVTTPGGGTQAFNGTWASTSSSTTVSPSACGNLQWQITEITATTASGTFTATCAGGVRVTGNAAGTLTGTTLNWTASGTAAPSQGPSCPFTLTGTAVPESATAIRVHYSGTVCGIVVSGSEVMQKK